MRNCILLEQKRAKGNSTRPVVPPVENQQEEMEYFNAYVLPVSEKSNIQSALDTHGAIRLQKGDYSGYNIRMTSGQKLYGYDSLSKISNITIASGSTGVYIQDLLPADSFVTLESGGVISNLTIKSVKWSVLRGTNVQLENCSFINYGGHIQIDCSVSGYIRNTKIIKHQSGTVPNILVMKGNSVTPSYGNVHLHSNFLTPHGDTTDLSGLQSATFVGIDAESWNFNNLGTKAMFYAQNMGRLKITDFGGGNGGSPYKTPSFDIDSSELFFLDKYNNYPTDVLSLRTNMFLVNGIGTYIRKSGTVTGYDLQANLDYSNAIKYNGVEQTTSISDSNIVTKLRNSIKGTQYSPWTRANFATLPDPLGQNWRTERIGKPDSKNYIQNLIDTDKIAELPEGKYYVGSTVTVPMDGLHGIKGAGSGKTVIVALTDDFPLISLQTGADGSLTLANLTLQGGTHGIYASTDYGSLNIAYQNMKFVVFRDMTYGIHLKRTGGFDNNFLENIGFVNCNIGFYQEPTPGNSGEINSAYVDKTMFYKNQFINCSTSISMVATRADNLNAWVDCKFDGGQTALLLASQNYPIVANCDFSNYNGVNVINTNSISMYNTNVFDNNVSGSTIIASYTNIEGCNFMDSTKMFSPMMFTSLHNHIINSTITGDILARSPSTGGYGKESAVYVNSVLSSNTTLSKLLVNVKEGVSTVIIDESPTPYPQLLVTQ